MILGHAHPRVVDAIARSAASGTSFGAPSEPEVRMAELMTSLVPSLEMVRMVNSGTEATMSAIRLERAFTGRDKIIKFEGCYHGHGDAFLIRAGSGAMTLSVPDSPGVPAPVAGDTLSATFNDLASVRSLCQAHASGVAAVIVEPVVGNMGCVPPVKGFLKGLRELCSREGIILIFDEVMTGNSFIENHCYKFNSDGTLTERKNSGWCGTPPISYADSPCQPCIAGSSQKTPVGYFINNQPSTEQFIRFAHELTSFGS